MAFQKYKSKTDSKNHYTIFFLLLPSFRNTTATKLHAVAFHSGVHNSTNAIQNLPMVPIQSGRYMEALSSL